MTGTRRRPGRRIADRAPRASRLPSRGLLLVALAPAVTLAAALLQAPAHEPEASAPVPPRTEPLTSASLACPAAASGSRDLVLGSGSGQTGAGEVLLRSGGDEQLPARLAPGGVLTTREPAGGTVVSGSGSLAPGLYGARLGADSRPAAGECVAPAGERWFVGVGAGGDHLSRLHLVNPDSGPAVADVTLWSTDGPLEEVESRGLTIPGGQASELDLEALAPHRDDLAMRVTVTRGRVSALVDDGYRDGSAAPTRDWIADSGEPATALVLPGLPRRAGERTLVLANPGDLEARVTLRVAGADSPFSPTDVPEIRVPAGRVVTTDLTGPLRQAVVGEDAALLVSSSTPVVGSMRSVVAGDLVHSSAVPPGNGPTAAMVPAGGDAALLLTASEQAGAVRVEFLGGRPGTREAAVRRETTLSIPVPEGTTSVRVTTDVPYLGAVRTVGDRGAALLPLRPLVLDHLIPHVAPAQSPR
jgi:hypothetical protein